MIAPVRPMPRAVLCFLLLVAAGTGSSPAAPPSADEAMEHFRDRDWPAAVAAFERVVAYNPYNGAHWQNYGFALISDGRREEAIVAFTESMDLGFDAALSQYNIACGHALLGHTDEALDALERAMEAGFVGQDDLIRLDGDLDSIRDDPRFPEITGIFPPEGLSRDEAWRYDLKFLARRLRQVHYDLFNTVSEAEFDAAFAALAAEVPNLEDHEISVGIQRILAMVGDGHTAVRPAHEGPNAVHQFPVAFYLFTDGLFVRGADPALAPIVGGRVLRLGRLTADEAMTAVNAICSVDNPMGYKSVVPRLLTIPEVLHALGITGELGAAELVVESVDGQERTVTLTAQPFTPHRELVRANAEADQPLPLYLKNADDHYWFEHLEDIATVYVQYNLVRDKPDESIEQFCDKLFAFVEESDAVERLVIDMRLNGGGNNFLNEPLVHGLIKCEKINQPGRLFVIVGRRTFSAAMNGAADIEFHTDAVFAGEPTGSSPNFIGETTMITLPCTDLDVSCSSLYWQRSHAQDTRVWIAPEIVAELSSEDYRTNRDPVMDAIRAIVQEGG